MGIMTGEKTRYLERTAWPGLVNALLWGTVVLSCYPILAGWEADLPIGLRVSIVLVVVVLVAGIQTLLGGLTVMVQESRLLLHLGSVPLIRKAVPFADIVDLRSVEYRPIREFGGWGVRGTGKRRAWTARGNRAVLLELTGERELLVGTDHPQRLEERIRTLAGERLGGTGVVDD